MTSDGYYDRERFRKALITLIKTDDDFLDKIYETYNGEL